MAVYHLIIVRFKNKKCNLTLAVSPTCPQHKPSAYLSAAFSITSHLRIGRGPWNPILILQRGKWIFSAEYLYFGPKGSKKLCCGDRLMFDLGAAIEIPCYFDQNSGAQISGWNNMGSLWEHLNWTLVDLHNITFSNS